MDLITFEKKQLMQQWKSSLVALARRDEALMAAQTALRDAQTCAKDYDTEIEGVKREILKSQARNETIVSVRDRLEAEVNFVEESLQKIRAERATLAERWVCNSVILHPP